VTERYRVGIVCGTLVQGGGGRYAYELCRVLDRSRFDIDLLAIAPWGVKRHYYAEPMRRFGTRIRPILPLFRFRSVPAPLRPAALAGQNTYRRLLLPKLLSKYDLIATLSLDHFLDVQFMLPDQQPVVVHLLNHLHQYPHNRFLEWPQERVSLFICMDRIQEKEIYSNLARKVDAVVTVPLPIDPSQFKPITEWPETQRLVIGCFMRLQTDRSPMRILHAFAHLVKHTDSELRFYGRGDKLELSNEARVLGIADRVVFCGHAQDMRQTILDDGINMVWLTGCDDVVGYAGIELALLAVPVFLFNVEGNESSARILEKTGGAIHAYSAEDELASATGAAWKSADYIHQVGRRLRAFIEERHNSARNVRKIETFYEEVIRNSKAGVYRQYAHTQRGADQR